MTGASDAEEISAWYQEQLRRFGPDNHRGVGWNRRQSQWLRFSALVQLGPFSARSVLDVGCGLADFLAFLDERDERPVYHGLDLCAGMIAASRRRFAGRPQCVFSLGDILSIDPSQRYDYAVASGIFGLRTSQAEARIAPTLLRMYSCCRRVIAVNFLSAAALKQAPGRLYCDPGKILQLGLSIAPLARLDHGYLANDFTLILYKEGGHVEHN